MHCEAECTRACLGPLTLYVWKVHVPRPLLNVVCQTCSVSAKASTLEHMQHLKSRFASPDAHRLAQKEG